MKPSDAPQRPAPGARPGRSVTLSPTAGGVVVANDAWRVAVPWDEWGEHWRALRQAPGTWTRPGGPGDPVLTVATAGPPGDLSVYFRLDPPAA